MTSPNTLPRFVATLLKASPRTAVASAAVTLAVSLTEGAGVLCLVPLLQLVGIEAGAGALGTIVGGFSSAFAAVGLRPTLATVLLVYVGLAGVQSLLQRWQATLTVALQQNLTTSLRVRVYRAIAGAKWVFLARGRSSECTHILTHEIDRVGAAAYYVTNLAVSCAVTAAYFAVAFGVSPGMTALVVGAGASLALTTRGRLEAARAMGKDLSTTTERLYAAIAEHLGSMKTAKGYGIEQRHADMFAVLSDDQRNVHIQTVGLHARLRQRLSLGVAVVLAIVVYVSFGLLGVSAAQLLLLLFLFARLMPRLTGLYETTQVLMTSLPAFEAVAAFERRSVEAAEPSMAQHRSIELRERISFERVTFDYNDHERAAALHEVDLAIPAGATTAIVGPSGAGKSTLADLLMGLLEPTRGQVLVDGRPLGPDQLRAWREQIGYVPQETFLFHDSVRANLTWARQDATEDDLWRALKLAAADGFVATLPNGLDTVVGDRGVLVSGGERQRLSLARALVRRPRVLILDEATSSLDSENETRIQAAIEGLHLQMTIVVITHRLSTIRGADLIHVIDEGRVVESGTWDALVSRRGGRFRQLCEAQGMDEVRAALLGAPGA